MDARRPSDRYPRAELFYVYSARWAGVTMCPECADSVALHDHTVTRIYPRQFHPSGECHRCRLRAGWKDFAGVTRTL